MPASAFGCASPARNTEVCGSPGNRRAPRQRGRASDWLGFGGAVTFERALQLRRLAASLPLDALVMETDSPDIQPHWLYRTAAQRQDGQPQARNEPGELPRIAEVVAGLRGLSIDVLAEATTRNAIAALPKLGPLVDALIDLSVKQRERA